MKYFFSIIFILSMPLMLNATIITQQEALAALEQLDRLFESDSIDTAIAHVTETIQELKLYNQTDLTLSFQEHELLDKKISEYDIIVQKKSKNKAYDCLVVKRNLLANNLTVCSASTFNNVVINGTLNGVPADGLADDLALLVNATSEDIPDTLVMRDGGSFAATTITLTGALQLQDSQGNIIDLQAATITAPYNLILPNTTGSAGQFLTIQSQSGDTYTLGWASGTSSSGTPDNIPGMLVQRDGTGSFASTTITLSGCIVLEDSNLATAGTLCGTTNAVILAPQGSRALQASTAGDPRGANAVDLQMNRSSDSQVASAGYSVIAGGESNTASGYWSAVGGGTLNSATVEASVVAGGYSNTAGDYAAVLGGASNNASAQYSSVVAGVSNQASATYSFAGGGQANNASGQGAVVVGGGNDGVNSNGGNTAAGAASFVGGGIGNTAGIIDGTFYDAVVSGSGNSALGGYSFVGGGQGNITSGQYGVVSGGQLNNANYLTFVGGGYNNNASSGDLGVIVGGYSNIIVDSGSIVGGESNNASGTNTFVGAGQSNIASGNLSTIGGGYNNKASGNGSSVVGGGYDGTNPNGGNTASGIASFVGGGIGNTAGIFNATFYDAVVSGSGNSAKGGYSFVGGGQGNSANAQGAVVVGGGADGAHANGGNTASGAASFVGGGIGNTVNNGAAYSGIVSGSGNTIVSAAQFCFIGGGFENAVNGPTGYIGGGNSNSIGSGANISTIVAGQSNNIGAYTGHAFIGAGLANNISAGNSETYSGIVSGSGNSIMGGSFSLIGGGFENQATGGYNFVGGGYANQATGVGAVVAGGGTINGAISSAGNKAIGAASFVGAGIANTAGGNFVGSAYDGVVSGSGNNANGTFSFVGSGFGNTASGQSAVVVGGGVDGLGNYVGNQSEGHASFIGSGLNNIINNGATYSGIVSGSSNTINANCSNDFIGGGVNNSIGNVGNSYSLSTILGGYGNKIQASGAAIAGGGYDGAIYAGNTAQGNASFIGGGINNKIINNSTPYSAIISGSSNTITIGIGSIIAGGVGNSIGGNYSFAAGQQASAAYSAFVWSDGSAPTSAPSNTFVARAQNGVTFYTSPVNTVAFSSGGTTFTNSTGGTIFTNAGSATFYSNVAQNAGVTLAANASAWTSVSDKNKKRNFETINHIEVLEKVAEMPIEKWSYKAQDESIRHMGPYAQDFHAAFGLGEDPLGISTLDADGVLFAAVKGMYQLYQLHTEEIAALKQEIADLKVNRHAVLG